ncbi:hypothetical protein HY839_01565 [Candidatus Azambacteria bacterium]|nr:hypothetical protein [Candidatus Azambacteria bacterium]
MEIKKLKSHMPRVHDNTEEDLIIVPPCVLENKLNSFEEYTRMRGSIGTSMGLALTLLVAVITSDFKDFISLPGASIRGAFVTAFIVILVLIIHNLFRLYRAPVKNRASIVKTFLGVDGVVVQKSKNDKSNHANKKTQ